MTCLRMDGELSEQVADQSARAYKCGLIDWSGFMSTCAFMLPGIQSCVSYELIFNGDTLVHIEYKRDLSKCG